MEELYLAAIMADDAHLLDDLPLDTDLIDDFPMDMFEEDDDCEQPSVDLSEEEEVDDKQPLPFLFPLDSLPVELIGRVLEYADLCSRFLLASTNRRFRHLVFDEFKFFLWPQGNKFSPKGGDCIFIKEPSNNDILLGRGARTNRHPGNKAYRRLILNNRPKYLVMHDKRQKTAMSYGLVRFIATYVGRFIKMDKKTGRHYILTEQEARRKVAQLLRDTKPLKWL